MNHILSSLYNCAMSTGSDSYLIGDDVQNLHSALRGSQELERKLREILSDDQLPRLEQYLEGREEAVGWEHIAAFHKGLAVGLKLGAFCILER